MKNEVLTHLVTILAHTDAICKPHRSWPNAHATHQAKLIFREKAGLAWHVTGGGSSSERDVARKDLAALAKGKWLTIARAPGQKVPLVKLTDLGEGIAREAVAGAGIEQSLETLRRLIELENDSAEPGAWIPEFTLAGIHPVAGQTGRSDEETDAILAVESSLLPALVRGWVTPGATARRQVLYRSTKAGQSAVANPPKVAPPPRVADEKWVDLYWHELQLYVQKVTGSPLPDPGNIAPVPVSMAALGWKKKAAS